MKKLLLGLLLIGCERPEKPIQPPPREVVEAIGVWEVSEPRATIELNSEGIASLSNGVQQNGAWESMGNQIWIFWDNGWVDLMEEQDGQHVRESFGPGTALDGKPDKKSQVVKTS